MHLLALSALLLPATALRLSDIQHSGPACPASSSLGVSITGVFPDVRVTIPGVSAAAERPMPVSSACEIGVTVDGGKAGQSLVLESVDVWGALGLAAGAKGRLITTAFWAETADDLAIAQTNTSTSRVFSEYISVGASLDLRSPCVGSDGHVGMLRVNFQVVSDEGEVTFGPSVVKGEEVDVSEHWRLRWDKC